MANQCEYMIPRRKAQGHFQCVNHALTNVNGRMFCNLHAKLAQTKLKQVHGDSSKHKKEVLDQFESIEAAMAEVIKVPKANLTADDLACMDDALKEINVSIACLHTYVKDSL